jgi:hypothetical protein
MRGGHALRSVSYMKKNFLMRALFYMKLYFFQWKVRILFTKRTTMKENHNDMCKVIEKDDYVPI